MNAQEEKKFTKRTGDAYQNQRKRARKQGAILDYTLAELRDLLQPRIGTSCPFCQDTITTENFSFDHGFPVSWGGKHSITHLLVVCRRCNDIKGP